MQPDEYRVGDTREWVARCVEDLENAEHDLAAGRPFVRSCLFHCQQAVEKACKGFLIWHDQTFSKTHSLAELGSLCASIDVELGDLGKRAAPLSLYAVRFRYPGEPYQPSAAEAKSVLGLARGIVGEILARLPRGVQEPLRE